MAEAIPDAAGEGAVEEETEGEEIGPVRIPITGELDLHAFRPDEIGDLLQDYFEECRQAGILGVRVIHGKGSGTLRSGVHARLAALDSVAEWTWPAGAMSGGWGATWVRLRPGGDAGPT